MKAVHVTIMIRAKLHEALKSREVGIVTERMKANRGIFVNKLIK